MTVSDVFLSYAREDLERARNLAQAIESLGWSVWWDRKIPAGRTFADVIEEALGKAKCVIVLWSRASVQSEWVREEADEAKGRRKLVPARLDDVVPPLGFRAVHAAELVDWDGSATTPGFRQLMKDLGSMLGAPPRGDATVMRTTLAPTPRAAQAPEAALPESAGANPWRWAPIVWGLAALLGIGGGGGMAYRISSDRAAQAEAARAVEEARVAEAARVAEEARRQREAAEETRRQQAAAEEARRQQAELDAAKRAADQERARAEQLKREMDERARAEAARRAADEKRATDEKRLAEAAAARRAEEEAERRKRELEAQQAKPRPPAPAPAPQSQLPAMVPFNGSIDMTLLEYARRNGINEADLTGQTLVRPCYNWAAWLNLTGTANTAFRAACQSYADYANANKLGFGARPSPQLWMSYCSGRVRTVPEAYQKEFMAVCLRYR